MAIYAASAHAFSAIDFHNHYHHNPNHSIGKVAFIALNSPTQQGPLPPKSPSQRSRMTCPSELGIPYRCEAPRTIPWSRLKSKNEQSANNAIVNGKEEILKRITARPEVFYGKPIIRDVRLSGEMILSLLSQGASRGELRDDY